MSIPRHYEITLPKRPSVRRIRKTGAHSLAERTQPLVGYDERFTDIVDYIVRITDEIWQDRAIGLIYDTYDADCVVYTSYGVTRGVDAVVRNTVASLAAVPDGVTHHLNVAWSEEETDEYYTAHLGFDDAVHRTSTVHGPATGRRYAVRFAADCISHANKIHTEWLVRDNGAVVRQIGHDLDEAARRVADLPISEPYLVAPQVPGSAESPAEPGPLQDWAQSLFQGVYNRRRLDLLASFYAADAIVHSGGGRTVQGLPAISNLVLGILAAIGDGALTVEHVCWSDETDGLIVAVRWVLAGSSARGGILGEEIPVGRPVFMMGVSHFRLRGMWIVEEWTVFDEIGVMAMAYRG